MVMIPSHVEYVEGDQIVADENQLQEFNNEKYELEACLF